jgi:hypothetical protein
MADNLKSLAVFVAVLAIAGLAAGGAYYLAVDLPQQQALENYPPDNSAVKVSEKCVICRSNCNYAPEKYKCLEECDLIC